MIKYILSSKVGVNNGVGPPVPIPNTEVKLIRAEDTWRATAWENKSMPTLIYPAQREVEQSPNRAVVFLFYFVDDI